MATTPRSQIALAQDANFLKRLVSLVLLEALVVVNESTGTTNHAVRRTFAQTVLNNPYPAVQNMALTIVNSTNLTAANTSYDFEAGNVFTDASDAAIRSQIATLWNAFSGV